MIVGGFICKVGNVSLIEIFCIMLFYGVGNISIDVMVRGEVGLLKNVFVYELNLLLLILLFSILEGCVSGGEELVIKGIGFGVLKLFIDIGFNFCEVRFYSDLLIKCIMFVNLLGLYDVLFFVDGKGYVVFVDLVSSIRFF